MIALLEAPTRSHPAGDALSAPEVQTACRRPGGKGRRPGGRRELRPGRDGRRLVPCGSGFRFRLPAPRPCSQRGASQNPAGSHPPVGHPARKLVRYDPEKPFAPIAQLDRASDYESEGRKFESCWAHQKTQAVTHFRPSPKSALVDVQADTLPTAPSCHAAAIGSSGLAVLTEHAHGPVLPEYRIERAGAMERPARGGHVSAPALA